MMNAHPTLGGFFDSLADSLAQNDRFCGVAVIRVTGIGGRCQLMGRRRLAASQCSENLP